MAASVIVLRSMPGIKRDGTLFEGDFYVDGQWVRFQRGLPRKIKGYKSTDRNVDELSRGMHTFAKDAYVYVHSGQPSSLQQFTLNSYFNASILHDRTPTSGFTASDRNTWMFDVMYSSVSTDNSLIAHVVPDNCNLSCSRPGYIYIGDVTDTAPLTSITIPANGNAGGGIVVLHPYLFYFGLDGVIGWSVAGTPTDLSGSGSGIARVTGSKVLKGMPLRAGAGNAPAGLFWSFDSVIRATFTGGSTVFQFDTISSESSIISKNSVIEYDGVYYWCGVDRFLMFNGVVREVPNNMNINWFFDNLNQSERGRIFAYKVPRFGEIWWCFPFGDAEECTHAVIYNVRENTWYDTVLPADRRCAAAFSNTLSSPILATAPINTGESVFYVHEQGTDHVTNSSVEPIQSYFETSDLSLAVLNNQDRKMRVSKIEPDFVQRGPMSVQIRGRVNARAPDVISNTVVFPEDATNSPQDQLVLMKEQRRELRVRFESNVLAGDYQMGQILMHVEPGDGTTMGG